MKRYEMFCFGLDRELKAKMLEKVKKENCSPSSIVREALRNYFGIKKSEENKMKNNYNEVISKIYSQQDFKVLKDVKFIHTTIKTLFGLYLLYRSPATFLNLEDEKDLKSFRSFKLMCKAMDLSINERSLYDYYNSILFLEAINNKLNDTEM